MLVEQELRVGGPAFQRLCPDLAIGIDEVAALDEELLAGPGQVRVGVEDAGVLRDEHRGRIVGVVGGELEAADGGAHEPPRRVRVLVQPLAIAGENDLVELREAVVAEPEVAQVDVTHRRLDTLPRRERDREISLVVVERFVRRGVERRDLEVAFAAVRLDDRLERRDLVRIAEAGVDLAVEVARPLDLARREDADGRRRLLEDRRHADDVGALGDGERHRVLEADAALRLMGGEERLRRGRGIRQHLQVDAGVAVPALVTGDEEAGVVGVRRPVEGEAHRRRRTGERCRAGRSRRAGRGRRGRGRRRGGRCRRRRRPRRSTGGDEQEGDGDGKRSHGDSIPGCECRNAAPGSGTAIRVVRACFLRWYEPDQVRRVCGRATLSARSRSPEAVFSCRPSLSPGRPSTRRPSLPSTRARRRGRR